MPGDRLDESDRARREDTAEFGSTRSVDGDRGVVPVVAVVLLFGLAVTGATLLVVVGAGATEELGDRSRLELAERSTLELRDRLAGVADGPDRRATRARLAPGGRTALVREGTLTVRAGDDPDCVVTLPLTTLEYRPAGVGGDAGDTGDTGDRDDDRGDRDGEGRRDRDPGTLAYQAGGVFQVTGSGVRTVAPPAVQVREGTLSVRLVEFAESPGGRTDLRVHEHVDASRRRTRKIARTFARPDCRGAVTLVVESDRFAAAWHDHLAAEVSNLRPDRFSLTAGDGRVRLVLDRRAAPVADPSVDLGDGRAATGRVAGDRLLTGDHDRTGRLELLAVEGGTVRIDRIVHRNRSRTPLDVVFGVDESCSMNASGCRAGPGTKLADALTATRGFVEQLRRDAAESGLNHRAAVVGFPGSSTRDPTTVHHELSSDLSSVRGSLLDYGNLTLGTPIGAATARALSELPDATGRQSAVVLVTDGHPYRDPRDWRTVARRAAAADVPVYAVAVGSPGQVNRSVTAAIARITGGESYNVTDADALPSLFEEVYDDVRRDVRVERRIRYRPLAVELSVGSRTVDAWTDDVEGAGLNRPGDDLSSGRPPVAFSAPAGEAVAVELTVHDCATTAPAGAVVGPDGESYRQERCETAGEPNRTVGARLYLDGDPLPDSADRWWEPSLSAQIPDRYVDRSGATARFDLAPNRAVWVAGDPGRRVAVLVDLGSPPTGAGPRVDLRVTEVGFGPDEDRGDD